MSGSFEDFLGQSDAAVDEGRRRITALREEIHQAVSKASSSLRECADALRRRGVEPDIELEDRRYLVRPEHTQQKRGFLQPKRPPEVSLGVDIEVLARRSGWTLSREGSRYALDTEGDIWLRYSLSAGVKGIFGNDDLAEHWPLDRIAEKWKPEGFTRIDLAAEAERASKALHVDNSGNVPPLWNWINLDVVAAEWPLFGMTHSHGAELRWSIGTISKRGLEMRHTAYDNEKDLIEQVFEDVRDKITLQR